MGKKDKYIICAKQYARLSGISFISASAHTPERKKHMKRKGISPVLIDIAIIAVAALVYAALISPVSVMTATGTRSHPFYRGRGEKRVSLQCAVSWDAAAMKDILDSLEEAQVTITFAVSGEWAERNPTLLSRMSRLGHEIATMGDDPLRDGNREFVIADVEASLEKIERITGKRPETYYCGTRDPLVSAKAGSRLGLDTVMCTIDLDCARGNAFELESRLAQNIGEGWIIAVQPTAQFSEALPFLIETIKNMGFDIVHTHKMLYN